jgi:hypothetical protein
MTDEELVKLAREWSENGPPTPPFYSTGLLILAMADRIEALKDYIKELEEYKWMYEELQK